MKIIVISLLLIVLASSYTYNIRSTSQCQTFDATKGVCTQWLQTGQIDMDYTACFIGQTLVNEKTKGFIQIKHLKVGDEIQTLKNQQYIWSKVEGWIHKSEQIQSKYLKVMLDNHQWIGVSDKHNIAYKHEQNVYGYDFPVKKELNSILYPANKKVISKQQFVSKGKYAPLTSQSSYLVYTSNSSSAVLAHDYANIQNPQKYESIGGIIFDTSKIMNGDHILNSDGINIAADWMMNNFGFLME